MESYVFKKHDIAVTECGSLLMRILSDNVVCKDDLFAEKLGEAFCNGSERIFHVELALRPAHVGAENYLCAVSGEVLYCGKRFSYALVIGDGTVSHGDIEIASYQNLFSGNINVFDCFLIVHHLTSEPRSARQIYLNTDSVFSAVNSAKTHTLYIITFFCNNQYII